MNKSEEPKDTKRKAGSIRQYATLGKGNKTAEPPGSTATTPQYNNPALPQPDITTKPQRSTKTQERDKITYYLDPGQFDKLEEMRLAYKKATGTRLNEQELMRLIIDRIELSTLL